MTAEVYVEADTNPNSYWWSGSTITNPHDVGDLLVHQLWHAAHTVTPLPNIDMWLGPSPTHSTKE